MLKIYKQKTYEGCLPISLMILGNIKATKYKEVEIIYKAVKKHRDSFYALNMLTAFAEVYKIPTTLYVNNLHYSKYLKKVNKNKNIDVIYQKINWDFIKKLNKPFTIYIDDFILGAETHSQHFIVVKKIKNTSAIIIDPWTGKKSKIKPDELLKAIESLQKTFLYSPLLITMQIR